MATETHRGTSKSADLHARRAAVSEVIACCEQAAALLRFAEHDVSTVQVRQAHRLISRANSRLLAVVLDLSGHPRPKEGG